MARKKAEKSEATDVQKAIRMCVDTGQAAFGISGTKKKALMGEGKLIIICSNAPADERADLEKYAHLSKIPVLGVGEDSRGLGALCGKPFPVSAMVVLEAGDSPILSMAKKK